MKKRMSLINKLIYGVKKNNLSMISNMKNNDSVKNSTIIDEKTSITGNINSESIVDVLGSFEGDIKCHTLRIRGGGVVKGMINADVTMIYGNYEGNISCEKVMIFKNSKIKGTIEYKTLSIEDGSLVSGECIYKSDIATQDIKQKNV